MPATCSKCGEEIYWIQTGKTKADGKPQHYPPSNDPDTFEQHECSGKPDSSDSSSNSGSRAGKVSPNLKKDIDEIKDKLDLILRVVRHLLEPDPENVEELKSKLKTVEGEMPW